MLVENNGTKILKIFVFLPNLRLHFSYDIIQKSLFLNHNHPMSSKLPSAVKQVSAFISNFFNPLTSIVLYMMYYSSVHFTWQQSISKFLPVILILIVPVSLWIFWNVKTGRYSNMDVSNRSQRKSLYFFIAAALLSYLAYEYFKTSTIDLVIVFVMVLLIMMQISNYFIKSSMHTAFNVFVAALFFAQDPLLGFIWLGIAALVGITRIILKRHTVSEVISGACIALFVSFIYLYTHIQSQY